MIIVPLIINGIIAIPFQRSKPPEPNLLRLVKDLPAAEQYHFQRISDHRGKPFWMIVATNPGRFVLCNHCNPSRFATQTKISKRISTAFWTMIQENGEASDFQLTCRTTQSYASLAVVSMPLRFGTGLFGRLDLRTGTLEVSKNKR
jgi:hypothetical protein